MPADPFCAQLCPSFDLLLMWECLKERVGLCLGYHVSQESPEPMCWYNVSQELPEPGTISILDPFFSPSQVQISGQDLFLPGIASDYCNLSIWKAEAGGLLLIWYQPELFKFWANQGYKAKLCLKGEQGWRDGAVVRALLLAEDQVLFPEPTWCLTNLHHNL